MKIVVENIFTCLVLFWKYYFPINFSHGNSTHGSKLRQSKATTTKIPPPHYHNNNKNQNHREREIGGSKIGRSKARSRGGEIEQRGAAIDETGAIWCMRSSDWSLQDRAAWCDRRGAAIDETGATSACDRRTGARGSPTIVGLDWSSGFALFFLSLSLSLSFSLSLSLSLSFSLFLSLGSEFIWSENRNENEFPWSKGIFYSQLKLISRKFYFPDQPNTRIYGKAFPEVIFTQNKHSLNCTLIMCKFNVTNSYLCKIIVG